MRVTPGEQWVRLAALTPANLGSSYGEATLDRPTQKDALSRLPFLPDSALKGVIAGRFGDQGDEREALFGSPDRPAAGSRPGRFGEAGPVVFGNGEILAFPVPAVDGPPAWVFPALHIAKALRLERAESPENLLRLLRAIEDSELPRAFAWPRLPRLHATVRLEPMLDRLASDAAGVLVALLDRYAGPALPPDAPRLVVSAARAGELWRFAAERRTLVQLDTETRTVADGALRFVELIPAGSVFLSWVSCFDGPGLEIGVFQAGAWEGLGLGWFQPSAVEALADSPSIPEPKEPGTGTAPPPYTRFLVEAHEAVQALVHTEPKLQRSIRSATRHFGGRAQLSGLESALSFELAKAKPAHPRPTLDARAHRWLLSALLTSAPQPPAELGAAEELLAWVASDPFAPGVLDAQRSDLLARWLWLARFCESLLLEEEGGE